MAANMDQTILNWGLAAISSGLGFLVKTLWDAVKDLQNADKELVEKVGKIELLVAGNYAKRTEVHAMIKELSGALFKKLDRIELKVDNKADK